jgi:hypothetical protein
MGTMQQMAPIVGVESLLRNIAEECNRAENEKAKVCPPKGPPTGEQCRTLGTKKHKCCEKKLKDRAKEDPPPKPAIQSEVPFCGPGVKPTASIEEAARSAAAQQYHAAIALEMAGGKSVAVARANVQKARVWANTYFKKGGALFRADVLVGDPPTQAYDFKFNCKPEKKIKISLRQRQNYRKYTKIKAPVRPIAADGRKC